MGSNPPCLSFIGIVDFSDEARWIYMTDSVNELLGYEPKELIGRPSLELVHPDELPRVRRLHYETITLDQAAVLVYLRMKHKDPSMGYILCGISRTVVHNVLVGSVSFASPAKAMHNAATAQEVTIVSPLASKYGFGRWHDPPQVTGAAAEAASSHHHSANLAPTSLLSSPTTAWAASRPSTPSSPSSDPGTSTSNGGGGKSSSSSSSSSASSSSSSNGDSSLNRTSSIELRRQDTFSFAHLPNQSLRTLFILDRFSSKCPILYCSNDLLVTTTEVLTRSFFDFVYEKDEEVVRTWINQVKSWGVNDLGQPSDGGFGYGWFTLLTRGRDSSIADRIPEPAPSSRASKHRSRGTSGSSSRRDNNHAHAHSHSHRSLGPSLTRSSQLPSLLPEGPSPQVQVDAIFSAHSDGLMVVLRRSEGS